MQRFCGSAHLKSSIIFISFILGLETFAPSHLQADPPSVDCTYDWHPNTGSMNFNSSVFATTTWDSDGPGPLSSRLYLGGNFSTAGGSPQAHIVSWNGRAFQSLGSGVDARVLALAEFNGKLIAGGDFTTAGGTSCSRIARWDGTSWQPLGSGINGTVAALTIFNGQLVAAGFFSNAGGVSANNIATWDGNSWSALGSGIGGSFPFVQSLAVYGDKLIAGGSFTSAGGTHINYIAQWDTVSWQPLGSGIAGFGYISAMGVYNGFLVAGGQFPDAGGTTAHDIALWDGSNWSSIGRRLNAAVAAMTIYNGRLVIGGDFNMLPDGTLANRVAQWDGTIWSALGSGTNDDVQALAVYNGDLAVGGQFTTAGGANAGFWSRWGPAQVAIQNQPAGQSACEGSSATFSVAATGVGTLSYQWRRGESVLSNGGNLSGVDTNALVVNPTGPADVDTGYNCVIVDSCGGTSISDDSALALTGGPTADAGGPYSGCEGGEISLNGTATHASDVAWSSDGTGTFTNGNSVNATYLPSGADIASGTVTLTLTASPNAPCVAPAISNTTLTIVQNPTADAGGPYATCDIAEVNLVGAAAHYSSVLWTSSGSGIFDNAGLLSAVYTPSPDDVLAGSVTLTLTASSQPPCAGPAVSNATLTLQAAPVSTAGGPYLTCGMTPVDLLGLVSGGSSFIWTTSGNGNFSNERTLNPQYVPSADDVAAGSIQLTLTVDSTEPCGTPATSNATLIIHEEPLIDTQPVGATMGVSNPFTFSVFATGGGLSYQWMKDGQPIALATESEFTIESVSLDDTGEYTCEITNECGSVLSAAAELVVNNQATVTLTTGQSCATSEQLIVSAVMTGATAAVVQGQFYFHYNSSVLEFVGATPGGPPFIESLYESHDSNLGTIDYVIGVQSGSEGTELNSTLLLLTFNVLQDRCTPSNYLLTWRANGPEGALNQLTDAEGGAVLINTVSLPAIKLDHTLPTISSPPDMSVQCLADVPAPATDLASFMAAGGIAGDHCLSVWVWFVGDSELAGDTCGGAIARTYRATDACGNASEATQIFTVQDTIAPQITDPLPIAGYYHDQQDAEDAAKASALAAAIDNCSGTLTASASTSGTCSASISVSVTDACGNVSNTVQFDTRIDGTNPAITLCASNQGSAADNQCQAVVPDFTAAVSASDDCSEPEGLVVTQNPTAGSFAGVGDTLITLTVTDEAGNFVTCEAHFEVTDQTPPTMDSCPSDIHSNVNAVGCTAIVTWATPTASDNCGDATVEQISGPAPGTSLANGSVTLVQYTGTDASQLTTTCSFWISVEASPDLNDDQVVNLLDVPFFVNVLIGLDTTPLRAARADANCDGVVDGRDVPFFLSALLGN